jgi:hypothetical protein
MTDIELARPPSPRPDNSITADARSRVNGPADRVRVDAVGAGFVDSLSRPGDSTAAQEARRRIGVPD